MADRNLFFWRHKTTIAGVAAISSFVVGLILPMTEQPSKQVILVSATQEQGTQLKNSQYRAEAAQSSSALTAKRNEALKKLSNRLKQETKNRRLTFAAPKQFQGKTFKAVQVSSKEKVIALTFDDGPWPNSTLQILEILKKNNVKATFFMVGRCVKNFPHLAKQVVTEGHAIGNHTWSHLYHHFSEAGAAQEIDRTANTLYETTGVRTALFRPPGGNLSNGLVAYAQKRNYAVVIWSADSTDYRRPPAQTIITKVLKDSQPGGIVLFHDGGGDRSTTVQALPTLIANFKKRGYKFVTVPELLEMQDKEVKVASAEKATPLKNSSAKKPPVQKP